MTAGRRLIASAVALVALASCRGPEPSGSSVRIVRPEEGSHSLAPAFGPIGVASGSPDYEFHAARTPRFLGDSLIVVANAFSEVRLYSLDGRHVRTFGRRGSGPEEFAQLQAMLVAGDTIFAWDGGRARMNLLTARGGFGRSYTVTQSYESESSVAALPGGELAIVEWYSGKFVGPQMTVVRDTVDIVVIGADGRRVRTLGRIAGRPYWGSELGVSGQPMRPRTYIARAGDWLVTATGDSRLLELRSLEDGAVEIELDTGRQPRRIDAGMLDDWEQAMRAMMRRDGLPDGIPLYPPGAEAAAPEYLPYYQRLMGDNVGCIWALQHPAPLDDVYVWEIIDPVALRSVRVAVARNVELWDARNRLAVGLATDDLGVQRIVGFRLVVPAGSELCS